MKCECCNTNEAIIHLAIARGYIHEEVARLHFCVECAMSEGLLWEGIKFFAAKPGNKMGQWKAFVGKKLAKKGHPPKHTTHECKGCDVCLSKSVSRAVEDANDASKQNPHPSVPEDDRLLKTTIKDLERAMSKAVAEEKYEMAAEFRDKINALKKGQIPSMQASAKPIPPSPRYGDSHGPVDGMQADGSVTKPKNPKRPDKPTK